MQTCYSKVHTKNKAQEQNTSVQQIKLNVNHVQQIKWSTKECIYSYFYVITHTIYFDLKVKLENTIWLY